MIEQHTTKKSKRGRGIYLIPNLFTVAGMLSGFYAIIAGIHSHYINSAIAIFIAALMDSLDGRSARLLHSQSEFGAHLDSLSDMLSFGLAPALLLYTWSLSILGKPGWLAAFLYTVCTALRLARFNLQSTTTSDQRYFYGLPTPAAALFVASIIWVYSSIYHISGFNIVLPITVITILLGFLKVSTVRYRSFKDMDLSHKVPFISILVVVLGIILISFDPPDILLLLISLYILSGPIETFRLLNKCRRLKKNKSEA